VNILILGGTVFLGRHIVQAALDAGHHVTIFHRGKHNPDIFPDVEKVIGDRDGGLQSLENRTFDAVIDPSGYLPRLVRASARLLAQNTPHYTFISSISVYDGLSQTNLDEHASVGTLEDETCEDITGDTYGPLKALCEQSVRAEMGEDRALIIRPGLIVGPFDSTDRFTYWPRRFSLPNTILAPGDPNRRVQFIDVRDLADWIISMVERRMAGTFNATGPDTPITMKDLLETCSEVVREDAQITWVDETFLTENEVQEWIELPLFISSQSNMQGLLEVNIDRAVKSGLTFRPLADTIQATLEWDRSRSEDTERLAGLSADKEQALLSKWEDHKSPTA
jgi:2'-hydroxyisoflavone reductase